MNAVDTNVLVYAIDSNEPTKQRKARDLLERLTQSTDTLLPWQVVGEYLNCLRRFAATGRYPTDDIEADIFDLLDMFPLALPTQAVITSALSLTSNYSLSHWDSMLIAACIEAGIDTLYTEDLAEAAMYGGLTIVNPFA